MASGNFKLRYALFCDYAFKTKDNKLSIIGEFDRLVSAGALGRAGKPVLENAYVVVSFDIVGKVPHNVINVIFTNEKGEGFSPNKTIKFHDEGGKANILIRLKNLTFPGSGHYFVKFLTQENEEIGKAKIDVSLLPSVIHE